VFQPFSDAMAQSMLLPAAALVLGFLAAISFARPVHQIRAQPAAAAREAASEAASEAAAEPA
jgi:hypothetical protein